MKSLQNRLFLVFVMCSICVTVLFGQAPMLMNYQGKLADADGNPLTGTYNVLFKIYDAKNGGSELWTEMHSNLAVNEGLFSVILGSVNTFPETLFSGSGSRYLEITVGAETLSPRFALTSVAYSIRANEADGVTDGAISTNDIQDGAVTQEKLADGITAIPAGQAGGDLAGDFPNNVTVKSINGRGVSAAAPDTGQVLKWNGSEWAPAYDISGGTVFASPSFSGNGTEGKPLDLSASGSATNGQVLQWSGTAWVPGTITVSGGNTLDQAYDQGGAGLGRTITADKGAVNIVGADGLTVEGAVTAASYTGSGTGLTGLIATNIASGVLKTSVLDEDLQDLADGSLTGAKVGTGISGTNVTAGTIADARLETSIDRTIFNASGYMTALGGMHVGGTADPTIDDLWVDGYVGIGTSSAPRYPLEILPGINGRGIFLDHNQTSNTNTYAVEVDLDKTDGGSTTGYGIRTTATNTGGTGSTVGIYGSADGTSTGIKYGVYGYAGGSGTLWAGYFQGDVYVAGKLTNTNTGVSLPIAYGVINSDGSVTSATSNVSCVYNSVNSRYEITISGYSYSIGSYVTAVTPIGTGVVAGSNSFSGRLLVQLTNTSGTAVQARFSFVTYAM